MSKLPMERQQEILALVDMRGIVSIRDLICQIEGSESTLRRDLRELEKLNLLRIGRGGVAAIRHSDPATLNERAFQGSIPHEKTRIGAKAASLLQDNETVVFDCGTTVLEMVKAIDPARRFTCITTSLAVANALCDKPQVEVIMIGGTVNALDRAVTGAMAIENLKRFHIDRYFLGAAGVSEASGVTGFNLNLIEIRKTIIELSDELNVLVDAGKFDKTGLAPVASLDAVDRLITDSAVSDSARKLLARHSIELIIA